MDDQVRAVLKGYLSLNSKQRKEIVDIIEDERHRKIEESTIRKNNNISMGPTGVGCPCCGR